MYSELLFFESRHFEFYKRLKYSEGYGIISITEFILDLNKVPETDAIFQIVDVSTLASLRDIQYYAEILLSKFATGTIFIADIKFKEILTHDLRYCFDEFNEIDIIEDLKKSNEEIQKELDDQTIKIIDLNQADLNEFYQSFNQNLYGHEKFKDEFADLIRNFRIFNKLSEHKILSLFLMGDSGVGKTEVARIIHKSLGGVKRLAKINFGNYSSDNSLNSLIGSPRGYIGSEEGEIFIRVKNSDTGLILIDEFEKSNSTLFNYFLDVLENGKMVSSVAEEIDLNGYIIIFTSNISKEDFSQRISPELRSRLDYKGYFTLLYPEDKRNFVQFRIQNIIEKFNKNFSFQLLPEMHSEILARIDVNQYKNMRDLNKKIKDTFVDFVSEIMSDDKNEKQITTHNTVHIAGPISVVR